MTQAALIVADCPSSQRGPIVDLSASAEASMPAGSAKRQRAAIASFEYRLCRAQLAYTILPSEGDGGEGMVAPRGTGVASVRF